MCQCLATMAGMQSVLLLFRTLLKTYMLCSQSRPEFCLLCIITHSYHLAQTGWPMLQHILRRWQVLPALLGISELLL